MPKLPKMSKLPKIKDVDPDPAGMETRLAYRRSVGICVKLCSEHS
jgi:hypothetical protein